MKTTLKSVLFSGLIFFIGVASAFGQAPATESKEAAYARVVQERAARIVATLSIADPATSARVQDEIARQYQNLNAIQDSRKESLSKLTDPTQKETIETEATAQSKKLHDSYLSALGRDLSPLQLEQVKDGMTYGVLPITYKGYQEMLPDLTDAQKTQILAYLTEARERAMDEGSSEKKHAMFGKYKGKINNYLSAAGIDMKKAGKAWEERIAAEKARK